MRGRSSLTPRRDSDTLAPQTRFRVARPRVHEYKKYPNRRLYDLSGSKYVTIDDVRETIIRGERAVANSAFALFACA